MLLSKVYHIDAVSNNMCICYSLCNLIRKTKGYSDDDFRGKKGKKREKRVIVQLGILQHS